MKISIVILFSIFLFGVFSCDRIENPIPVNHSTLNWDLYPGGDSANYPWPTWTANTNTQKNVLLEDYTGQLCTNCPAATTIAHGLVDADSAHVILVSVHASNTGAFQATEPPEFTNDFTTPAGNTYATDMTGFLGNPMGCINRNSGGFGGTVWYFSTDWSTAVPAERALSPSINLQLQYNYYPSTRGLFVHTETEVLSDLNDTYNLIVFLLRDSVIGPQKLNNGSIDTTYHHHAILSDNINGTWGTQVVGGAISAGEKIYNNFSYAVPNPDSTFSIENLSLVTFVCNRSTYAVEQVIKTELK